MCGWLGGLLCNFWDFCTIRWLYNPSILLEKFNPSCKNLPSVYELHISGEDWQSEIDSTK